MTVDHRVRRQEPLRLTAWFEPLHLPLSSSRASMRIFGPIVQIPARAMPNIGQDRSLSDATAAQAAGDEAPRLALQPMQRVFEEALGSGAIPTALQQNVQYDAVPIHRTPQPMQHAPDADEHFIEMPSVSWLRPSPAQPSREVGAELQTPVPNARVG
jgi:hypothetical protein